MNACIHIWKGRGIVFFAIMVCSCFSCSDNTSSNTNSNENTQVTGEISILADDTYKALINTSVETFEAIYNKSKINIVYKAQQDAIRDLLEGKTDVVISGRSLTKNETERIAKKGLYLKENKIASDALVFIMNQAVKDTVLSMDDVSKMFLQGRKDFKVVCDKSNSANIIYLKERFKNVDINNIFAAGSDSAVIEYVKKDNHHSIGIIGSNSISDYDDKKVLKNLADIKVMSIRYVDSLGNKKTGYPSQEEIYTGTYPFTRNIYVINTDAKLGLGTGFASFLLSERGQRIILKSGLLPAKMPTRDLIIN